MLASVLGRRCPPAAEPLAETLELVDQGDAQSIVENGELSGKALRELVAAEPAAIVGHKHDGAHPFPLVLRHLNSNCLRPLRVHPDKRSCAALGLAEPKAEMWYVLAAREGATITVGIKPSATRQQFVDRLNGGDLEALLHVFPAQPGDAYYISPGRVHAFGADSVVLAVEENSPTTLTFTDWQQPADAEELEQAIRCVDFQDRMISRVRSESSTVDRNRKVPLVTANKCPVFIVDEVRLVGEMHDRADGRTFHLLSAVDGAFEIRHDNGVFRLEPGRTCLIPALMGYYVIVPESPSKLLKTAMNVR